MNQMNLDLTPEELVRSRFEAAGISIGSLDRRDYPGETIFIVRIAPPDYQKATSLANSIDHELSDINFKGFVTVRPAESTTTTPRWLKDGVADAKANELGTLLTARSRTSEIQPSLNYIPDTARNITTVTTPRHQLIFGRRGAGKTALMVEAKRRLAQERGASVWVNLQTLRLEAVQRSFVFICQRICDAMQAFLSETSRTPQVLSDIAAFRAHLDKLWAQPLVSDTEMARLIPSLQQILRRFLDSTSVRMFIFIDDLHYLPRTQQPILLDALHGAVRDCDAWLKIAGIKHLCRWFEPHPPRGLQTGHDADPIDLDITLENPSKAKAFLEEILVSYARTAGITSLASIFLNEALDRLVLASGAVPRDYLVLSAGAVRQAQRRERARVVGVQDVNKAAGEAAQVKLTELEDDASPSTGTPTIVTALQTIRAFCLDDKRTTYFRIDFRDKEQRPAEYGLIQDLMDLRLLHLIDSSLSDEHEAGRRSEVYMLDLSQFSGQRLKKQLKVIDFAAGHLVLKQTGTAAPAKVGGTPKQRQGLLRRGPLFALDTLAAPN
jgi:hypothetical protein